MSRYEEKYDNTYVQFQNGTMNWFSKSNNLLMRFVNNINILNKIKTTVSM